MNEKIITFKHFKSLVEYFKGKLSGKANNNHTHDDRYYTEAEMNTKLAGKSDSGHSHSAASQSAAGLMSAADKTKLDGIATGANKYTHPATSGNKHIPSGGSSGQVLRWGSDGTAVWGSDNNTTYSNMGAASASAAGKSGLVPAPAAGAQGKYLRGDGTWQTPPNTTYAAASQSANGLMSAADKKKLDGLRNGGDSYTIKLVSRSSGGGDIMSVNNEDSDELMGDESARVALELEPLVKICDLVLYRNGAEVSRCGPIQINGTITNK